MAHALAIIYMVSSARRYMWPGMGYMLHVYLWCPLLGGTYMWPGMGYMCESLEALGLGIIRSNRIRESIVELSFKGEREGGGREKA